MKINFRERFLAPIFKKRIRNEFSYYLAFLKELGRKGKVIDIGCGSGLRTEILAESLGKRIFGTDLENFNWTRNDLVNFFIFNGKKIPYGENYFSCGFLFLVLHHADDPAGLILESARACQNLLIEEEFFATRLERLLLTFWDKIINFLIFGKRIKSPNFLTLDQWYRLFESSGLLVAKEVRIFPGHFTFPKRVIFFLKKK